MEDSVVRCENLTVRYGSKIACAGVTFEVPRGSVYALLGRNGAGKSSLVRCLLGHQKPQLGRALLFGEEAWSRRSGVMQKVGVVPEEPDAPREMTAAQLAAFCSPLYPVWDDKAFQARLGHFGIPRHQAFKNLSRGQKSMLLFALALAPHPDLLVLDDPTLGLDVVARKSTLEDLVGDLADRAPTVLVTTHDLQGIEGIADRVGILNEGKLLMDSPMEELKSRYRRVRYRPKNSAGEGAVRNELVPLAVSNIREINSDIEAVISNYEESAFGRFQCAANVEEAEVSTMSLEEILIAVTEAGSESMI